MYLKHIFELTMILHTEKFNELLNRVYGKLECFEENKYVDHTLVSKGITVIYYDSQYKKKIKLIVNPCWLLNDDEPNEEKLIRKLDKRVNGYFNFKYHLNNFNLTGMVLTTDIDVHDKEKVSAYIKVLQRIGKIKGFSPPRDNWLNDDIGFCLDGNSNGIGFMVYDLEGLLREQSRQGVTESKEQKAIAKKSKGLLRAEVRLMKPKAIPAYTDEVVTSNQIADLSIRGKKTFLDTFMRVVPFGNFYKKDKAVEIIRREVTDDKIKRRMLRLLELIPEKKSLLLAQKSLNYRKVDDVMEAFAAIDLSPVTLSKRHDVRELDNLYKYL